MGGHRALFWHEVLAPAGQYRLRIRNNNPGDNKQWFVFNSRTHTIRTWSDRRQVIANQVGQGFIVGKAAVVRPWKSENFQKIQWHGGSKRNIRNNGGKCLDVWGGKNVNLQHLTFWDCHNGLN
jgi:hypothetical protein